MAPSQAQHLAAPKAEPGQPSEVLVAGSAFREAVLSKKDNMHASAETSRKLGFGLSFSVP